SGTAYSKAWGGRKDVVYDDLSGYINVAFHVDLTERVGSDIWYRGTLGGKRAWLRPNQVFEANQTETSLLGHIRSRDILIYDQIGGTGSSATAELTNAVYYIKLQSEVGGQTYYLLSTSPSSEKGIVGWARAEDISAKNHVGVDK